MFSRSGAKDCNIKALHLLLQYDTAFHLRSGTQFITELCSCYKRMQFYEDNSLLLSGDIADIRLQRFHRQRVKKRDNL